MPRKKTTVLVSLGAVCLLGVSMGGCTGSPERGIRQIQHIPVQHGGRIKSFDAFSHSVVELITGKPRWQSQRPVQIILLALKKQESLLDEAWIEIRFAELKKTLGLNPRRDYFSYHEIHPSFPVIEKLTRSSRKKRQSDIRPSKLEQKTERLYAQLLTVQDLSSGRIVNVIPTVRGIAWASPYESPSRSGEDFKKIVSLYAEADKREDLSASVGEWLNHVHSVTQNVHRRAVDLEVLYYNAKPFRTAHLLYLLAFVILTVFQKKRSSAPLGIGAAALAFFFHTWGLALRVMISSRPPVSNMYESMTFMNWALILFALIFSVSHRNRVVLAAGSLLSALVMIYSNLLPLDSGLDVLLPVLRSNYWLTIHVMTIVSSYGAFGLAMALGHRHLLLRKMRKLPEGEAHRSAELINRVIQTGVLLLAAGTVLGGVWANESWGRFWGWDPKETWALITLLGYLILVHLRRLKRIDDLKLALGSILGFFLVLMTWYGVNFILGGGLHSYGRGSGGLSWIGIYLIFEILFLALTLIRTKTQAPC